MDDTDDSVAPHWPPGAANTFDSLGTFATEQVGPPWATSTSVCDHHDSSSHAGRPNINAASKHFQEEESEQHVSFERGILVQMREKENASRARQHEQDKQQYVASNDCSNIALLIISGLSAYQS